ncbi:MAG: lipopolysaccharide assembly protein LapB [Burkholderiales bacterium]|jgi:lipopolysaccharide biosynthesis regulator YciM|nr:lipopolysaccharide assembly protein LapB [Burkholderiales bacterium]
MHIELWWLLLIPVVFFALGWVAARIDIKQLLAEARELPKSYFIGLNHLLSEEPEQAIESFISVVDKDPKTLDLHFALGTLFRRQGEFSRAIRMHQSLLERPSLTEQQRERAKFELAQDFHRAGLLDRAETLFLELEKTPYEHQALGDLLEIYETEKNWQEAIRVTRRMENVAQMPHFKEIAHYHCEIAENALVRHAFDEANTALEHAFTEYRACARAFLLKGDIAFASGKPDAALTVWEEIAVHQPAALGLAAERVMRVCRNDNISERIEYGIRLLTRWQNDNPSPDIFGALFSLSFAHEGAMTTVRRVKDEINERPTLVNLDYFLEAQIAVSPERDERINLIHIKELIAPYLRKVGFYRCARCGFRARQYYWRCPGCGQWETTQPRRSDMPEGFQ